jgi:hypothetical protein
MTQNSAADASSDASMWRQACRKLEAENATLRRGIEKLVARQNELVREVSLLRVLTTVDANKVKP